MFDWDDLRIFLAAVRCGSLNAAAASLALDATTVGRRIGRLEAAVKSTLIVRSSSGLRLTATGARLLESALGVEAAMIHVGRGEDDLSGGSVRISAAEGFGGAILAPALPELRSRHPKLRIELAAAGAFLSPGRREVDLAVTLSAPPAAQLVVEPLTDYQLAIYASAGYLERRPPPRRLADLRSHDVVGYVEDLIYAPELRYLHEIDPALRPQLACSSIRAQREIIHAGGGLGVLPCFMADGLVRLLEAEVVLTRRFWMSTHGEVAETARVRAVRRWLIALVAERRTRLIPFAAGSSR